jgi:hypothetical protein
MDFLPKYFLKKEIKTLIETLTIIIKQSENLEKLLKNLQQQLVE